LAALAGTEAPVPESALHACAAISTPGERLACYDQLAGRASALPTASAPAATPQPSPGVAAPASPAPPPKGSFGLYHAEHPAAPPPAASLTAKVVGIGATASGRPTVALEGGQLWELDGPDPLLANGDSVTIQRASFGSFVMTTPTRRTHRVHRLR
jgi:hypothetical protein